jgi:4a-hydroxytetrahydrobiopterin dehydratase
MEELMSLIEKKCVPCEGGVEKYNDAMATKLLEHVDGWNLNDNQIQKRFEFGNFVQAMDFLNQVKDVAEEEGHHPDFCVHYNKVDFTIWTHAIGGLSENDFILAAKIDHLLK